MRKTNHMVREPATERLPYPAYDRNPFEISLP
jgi:hypothetical protein